MPNDAHAPDTAIRRPAVAAGMVCFKDASVLLIRIGKAFGHGEWSIPGGHVEWGETTKDAAVRETLEETGITAEIVSMIEVVDAFMHNSKRVFINERPDIVPDRHLVLVDYVGRWVRGDPQAGDDALDAEFVPLSALDSLGIWTETLRVIREGARIMGLAV
jgi:8-oxo-dGTP diphosphatase